MKDNILLWLSVIFDPAMLFFIGIFMAAVLFAGNSVKDFYDLPECYVGYATVIDNFRGAILAEQDGRKCVIKNYDFTGIPFPGMVIRLTD